MSNNKYIGKIVKKKRRIYGLNQIDFAFRAGIGLATLRDIEQGKDTIKLSSLNTVLDALGLKIAIENK